MNIFNNNNNNINNLFSNNNNNIFGKNRYEDNSKYINLGNEWNLSRDDTDTDFFSDPFNPKWNKDDNEDNRAYDKDEYNMLTQRVKDYCNNNQGSKNYLEYCDKNSETLKTIRNMNLSFEDNDF